MFLVAAQELGLYEETAKAVVTSIEPVLKALNEPEDLGLYYYSEARCAEACKDLDEDVKSEACVLLWHVATRVREAWAGAVTVELRVLQAEMDQALLASTPSLHLQGLPLFGGFLERPVAPGAVNKLRKAVENRGKVCKKMRKEAISAGKSPVNGGGGRINHSERGPPSVLRAIAK